MCRAAGEPLAVEEIVVDPPKAYEVRIRIVCTSLCHSDLTFWRMKVWPALCPFRSLPAASALITSSQVFVCVLVILQDFPGIFPRIFGHEAFG